MIQHRITLSLQEKGNVGKSTEVIARSDWMLSRNIPFRGFDLDPEHTSYSSIYPDLVTPTTTEPIQDVLKPIFQFALSRPVTVLDPQAHLGHEILHFLDYINYCDHAATLGCRLTVIAHVTNEPDVIANLTEIISRLNNKVDYLVVHNQHCAPILNLYEGSHLASTFDRLGAKKLIIPSIGEQFKKAILLAEYNAQRRLTLADLTGPQSPLDFVTRGYLEHWRHDLHSAYDQVAPLLIPESEFGKIPQSGSCSPYELPPQRVKRGAGIAFESSEVM